MAAALVAASVLTACGSAESATTATPAPQPTVSLPPTASPEPAAPEQTSATPESTAETTPDPGLDDPAPVAKPQRLTEIAVATPTPAAGGSGRRNPPPAGGVDCATAKCIALTFDDGPGPHTSRLLGMLSSKGARATFFLIGTSVSADPGTARQIANTPGMEIGNHSRTHPELNKVGSAQLRREIVGTHATIKDATGRDATVFRPPYGARNAAVDTMAAEAGEGVILWDVDTLDWKTRSATATRRAVAQEARPGSIVLMHDIHGSTVDAVPGIIDDLQNQGYVLVTVSELLGGTTPGRVYSRR